MTVKTVKIIILIKIKIYKNSNPCNNRRVFNIMYTIITYLKNKTHMIEFSFKVVSTKEWYLSKAFKYFQASELKDRNANIEEIIDTQNGSLEQKPADF